MSDVRVGEPTCHASVRTAGPTGSAVRSPPAVDWLGFAAGPVLATMALLTATHGASAAEMCSPHASSPFTGMVAMYLIMAIFHSAPRVG